MAGLWELPGGPVEADDESKERVAAVIREVVGLEILDVAEAGRVEHLFTHRRLALDVFRCRLAEGGRVRRRGFDDHRWVRPEAVLDLAHAGPTRKALALLGWTDETSARAAKGRPR